MSLSAAYDRFLPLIEADLKDVLAIPHPELSLYYGMMHYHMGWVDEGVQPIPARGGKRLRPVLCLLACSAAGGDPEQALPAGTAVELVHNFSLVHDDIEDGSHLRRSRRAVWDVWGLPHGINVGDGLFVLARMALHRLADRGVPAARRQSATLGLDQACLALCEGQFFDMSFESRQDVTLDDYLWMIRNKTAALLAASTQLGAVVATDDAHLIRQYTCFGENLGMAFQIQDDVLGAWGNEELTGKSAATDIRDRKKTLPVVYALSQGQEQDACRRLAELYGRQGSLDESSIVSALALLEQLGAREYAEETAGQYYRLAIQCLDETGLDNAATSDLRELAASLLGRRK